MTRTMTVRQLVDHPTLGLAIVQPGPPGALDRPVSWVHQSELADSALYTEPGEILLTTGSHLPDPARAGADALARHCDDYCRRLRDTGVVALGFGVGVGHDALPDALAAAALEHGLPVFLVPYELPFSAVVKVVSQSLARAEQAELRRGFAAQRRLVAVASGDDVARAVIVHTAETIGGWAALVGPGGVSVESSHRSAIPQAEEAAREHLAGGRTVSFAPGERLEVCACTVGPPTGAPLGVLVAAASPEQGSFATSTCMFAANLLAVALVRADAEDDAAGQVRAAVMAELLHGNVALARRVARALWSGLPLEPVAVVCADGDPAARAAFQADLMPLRRTTRAPAVAFATWQDRLWLVVAAATADSWRARIARGGQLVCGLSGPTPWSGIAQARQQALGELALARCADGGGRVDLVDLLGPDQALGYVRALLGPLADDPELLATLAAWARLDGAIDQVAADLGIHRHTVRRRLARIEAATGLDLRDPRTRHEVWFACTAHDRLM